MITNPNSLAILQAEWDGVVRMRERMRNLVVSTFALNTLTSPAFGDILYNLPFLLAFDVLKQVLVQAREEGQFIGIGHQLGDLVDSAKTSLSWNDWQCLREAVRRRNEVVKDGKLFGDVQCLQDMADIETQLVAWGIIPAV
jgi:hypothetical protein